MECFNSGPIFRFVLHRDTLMPYDCSLCDAQKSKRTQPKLPFAFRHFEEILDILSIGLTNRLLEFKMTFYNSTTCFIDII